MRTWIVLVACLMMASAPAFAMVTRLAVEKTTPMANGYELLEGSFIGALDPRNSHNALINDIALAPRNAEGRVEYSATFAIARPVDMEHASGMLVYDVPNRGHGAAVAIGDRHVNVVSGWQGDLEDAPDRQFAHVPSAPVTGLTFVRFMDMPGGVTTMPIKGGSLGSQGGRSYEPVTSEGMKLFSGMSDSEPRNQLEVPREDWALADCTITPFPGRPDITKLCVKGGFDPERAYMLAFKAKDPKILGVGFAATRDLVAFLRYDRWDDAGNPNPLAGKMRWAVGRGVSQSGNFLRAFVNLNMNTAENGLPVFDGINPIVAMRMNAMNHRFAAPGGLVGLYEPGNDGINWWSDYDDEVRGIGKHGLLDRCRTAGNCPKVMEILGSAEFWNLRASVNFVGTDLKADIPLPANVRRYYNAGVHHNGGTGGFNLNAPPVGNCVLASNPNPTFDTNRALFRAFLDWVMDGVEPPASKYPTLAAGDLVTPEVYSAAFPAIPGQPRPAINPLLRYDFGESFNYTDLSGVMGVVPPRVIGEIPQLVPRADADGNELAGIRSSLLSAPLGSYVGWNVAAKGFQAGRYCGNAGGYVPFAATKAERLANGDPRPSLEERYSSHAAYVARVKRAADDLVSQRYLLPADADRLVREADASKAP